jgi:phage tail-like protein
MFSTIQGGAARTAAQNFRADVEIQVLAHPIPTTGTATAAVAATGATKAVPASTTDTVAMRFQVYNAWPTSVSYSDLNAGDNAIFVEQLTLVHEGFDVNWGSAINTTAAEFEA